MTKWFEVSKITKISFKLNLNMLNGAKTPSNVIWCCVATSWKESLIIIFCLTCGATSQLPIGGLWSEIGWFYLRRLTISWHVVVLLTRQFFFYPILLTTTDKCYNSYCCHFSYVCYFDLLSVLMLYFMMYIYCNFNMYLLYMYLPHMCGFQNK